MRYLDVKLHTRCCGELRKHRQRRWLFTDFKACNGRLFESVRHRSDGKGWVPPVPMSDLQSEDICSCPVDGALWIGRLYTATDGLLGEAGRATLLEATGLIDEAGGGRGLARHPVTLVKRVRSSLG